MASRSTPTFTWDGAAAALRRMAEANRKAHLAWLDSLTDVESAAVLEDLCQGFPELEETRPPKEPPIVLFRIWRS